MIYPMNTVIARRSLLYRQSDGQESEVQLLIGQPMLRYDVDSDSQDWFCPVQITGIGDNQVQAAFGEDSVQALYFALILAGQLLKVSGFSEQLTWHDIPNYGLPTPDLKLPQSVLDALADMSEEDREEYKALLELQ